MRKSSLIFGLALGVAAAILTPAAAETGVTDKEIVIGQSLGLSGPLGELGQDIAGGTRAYFEAVNYKGGINGRRVKVITLDDGYQVGNTVKNVQQMIDEDQVFALFNIMGTPNSAAALPLVDKAGIPFFSPFTGAELTRTPLLPGVFNIRASYRDEAEKIVQHLTTIGIKRVAVVYQANAFGKDGLAGVEAAMTRRGMKPHSLASIQTDASDAQKAVQALHATQPESVILITAGKPTFEFIKAYNTVRRGMQFYTLSVMGAQANIKALGPDGVGVVVATVVPFPWSQAHPLVKEYQAAMHKIGLREFSFVSFEAYLNSKVLGEALRRAGKDLTRGKLIAAAEGMKQVSFGGFDISFGKDSRQGSRFVDLTIIGPNGRFTK
jgi:branched-chain amino acid transport system substrate-binding protein